jgi:cyclophilin family peptidyl-prolyl cis-trans isomerase
MAEGEDAEEEVECWFDIEIEKYGEAGRIMFELYNKDCPKTVSNFAKLCEGKMIGKAGNLHYKRVPFHRIIPVCVFPAPHS